MTRVAHAALLAAAVTAGCSQPDDPAGPARPHAVGVYAAEAKPWSEIQAALPTLAQHRVSAMVALPTTKLGSAALRSLLREARRQQVEVRLWPLLEEQHGYWPNETNAARFAAEVRKILDWLKREQLVVSTIVYDMEPAIGYSRALQQAYDKSLADAVQLMRTHLDRAALAKARATFAASVKEVQARGLRAQCVTFPQALDDHEDGDDDLQDALDIPVAGIGWDELSFMVYQSVYARSIGAWVGPGLIRVYAEVAARRHGSKATIALGVVGRAGVMTEGSERYDAPADLTADVAAALAEKIERVEVFSLDGMLQTGRAEQWLAATATAPKRPAVTFNAKLARQAILALDKLLDAGSGSDGGTTDAAPAQ